MNTTSVIHANLTPVTDINDFLIDVEDVERKITDKTVAIVAVSLYGRVPDLKKLRVLCDKHSLLLIEDNAQCVKASRNGIKVGSLADACSWSFENTKHLSSGEGGMVTTNNQALAQAVRKVAGHGFKNLEAQEAVSVFEMIFSGP